MPVKLFKKHKQVQLKYSKKKTDDRCCTFVSRIEGGWEHINDLWNAKWKQQITFDLPYKATTVPNVVINLKLVLQSTLKKHMWLSHLYWEYLQKEQIVRFVLLP